MEKQFNINDLFEQARNQSPETSFEATKQRFLSSIEQKNTPKKKAKIFTLKNGLIMLALITSLSLSWLLIQQPHQQTTIPQQSSFGKKEIKISKEKYETKNEELTHSKKSLLESTSFAEQLFQPFSIQNLSEYSLYHKKIDYHWMQPLPIDSSKKSSLIIPRLTTEQIKANNTQKKKMLKELSKVKSDKFRRIPSGSFNYQGKAITIQQFYMGTMEVTNLEYRTFLNDLLIKGKTEEYIDAYPTEANWINMKNLNLNAFKDVYFTHPAFDHYPVVNVSFEGVQMYCKWFMEEFHEYVKIPDVNDYRSVLNVRIPTREEWCYAASSCGKYTVYPWGNSLKNKYGMYEANCIIPKDSIITTATNTQKNNLHLDVIAVAGSYNTTDLGLYNISGNVAEYVYNNYKTNDIGTAGGGWMDNPESIKIYAEDPYQGMILGSPNIGFRIVFTMLDNVK